MKKLMNFGTILSTNELRRIKAGNLPPDDHHCWSVPDPISCFAQEDASQYDNGLPASCIEHLPLGHPMYDDCPGAKITKP